jgi:hypothetical protein
MIFPGDSQSTNSRLVLSSRAYVVYDATTGDVLHIHHAVTPAHVTPAREDDVARARRLAGKKAGANAQVLEVDPAELRQGHIRIDPAKRTVIRENAATGRRPPRPRRAPPRPRRNRRKKINRRG